jgi:hypothetical protein
VDVIAEHRAMASLLRDMAAERLHHTVRQRLLEVARQFEQEADIRAATTGLMAVRTG